MAFLEIPVDTQQPDHEFSIELDGTTFLLRFHFNFRSERWMMDVKQEDGTVLLAGIPLVTSWPLISRFKDERLPLGGMFVLDRSGLNTEPGELSFGSTHALIYVEDGTT